MAIFGLVLTLGGIIVFAVSFDISLAAFRGLVDLERASYPDTWAADGKPSSRPFPDSLSQYIATIRAFNSWLAQHPSWLPPASSGSVLRHRMVRWFLLSALGILFFGAGVLIFGNAIVAA